MISALWILIRHALGTSHLLQRLHQVVAGHPKLLKQLRRGNICARESEKIMLRADEFVSQLRHLLLGRIQHVAQLVADHYLDRAAVDLRAAFQIGVQTRVQAPGRNAHFLEERTRYAISLIEQGNEKMLVRYLIVMRLRGKALRSLHRFLHLLREPVESHSSK